MHPRRSAQEVLLCDLCETVPLHSHCELCNIDLCANCAVKHISDSSKRHNVVHYLQRKSTPNYPTCPEHAEKHCELHCEKCDIPVCSTCVSSGKHEGHKLSDILENFSAKMKSLQKDLEELEARIFPQYESMVSDFKIGKAELETNYGELTKDAEQQGEILHQEVTAIVNQRKTEIQEMKTKHLSIMNKNTEEITQKITELKQIIADLKSILKSKDVSLTSTYKSRNSEFRTVPSKPSFSPWNINNDQLNEMHGSLSTFSINKEHSETMKSTEAVHCPSDKPLQDKPRLTTTINTEYSAYGLYSVSCLNEEMVWTRGNSKTMKLLNLQGKLLTSIQTESGDRPHDIAVTRNGNLVYTDPKNKSVNLVKNEQIQTIITLLGWTPHYVCSTMSDGLLITMNSDDGEQSKVVRYSGSTKTQTIQFDDQGRPLYSSDSLKYINENRNLDVCVSDVEAKAVVVVNQSGKLRFRYAGHPSNTKESFYPRGIATDSYSHILTADCVNHCIHILNQDGQFLRYIQSRDLRPPWGFLRNTKNYDLREPWGLCVDTRDNLFVAECCTSKVKTIKYL